MDESHNEIAIDSNTIESAIQKSFTAKKVVTAFEYPLTATALKVPAIEGEGRVLYPERHLVFTDTDDKTKALLYKMLVAAYNHAFCDAFAVQSAKGLYSTTSPLFVEWLNHTHINNVYSLLKDYEGYCFDKRNNHGGASELPKTKAILNYAIDQQAFRDAISQAELALLLDLHATKVSPNLNKKQISLASYFGALDWLRRDDVGVGAPLYQVLASPKLTVNSLKLTCSTVLNELYQAKLVLQRFLHSHSFSNEVFDLTEFKDKTNNGKRATVGRIIYALLCRYHDMADKNLDLQHALQLVLLSNVTSYANFEKVLPALESKAKMEDLFLAKTKNVGELSTFFTDKTFSQQLTGALLSMTELAQLRALEVLPITAIEALMFTWLMASLTVQPSDVAKLSKHSFRLLRVAQRVTHIECEYFKGRSNAIHTTQMLSTRKPEGRALLRYLNQHHDVVLTALGSQTPLIKQGLASLTGTLDVVLNLPFMQQSLQAAHKQAGDNPVVVPKVLTALIRHGKHTQNIMPNASKKNLAERQERVSRSETPCATALFGPQAIKNSAVHAYSDPYTLHYLINRHSHTNQTEKQHYLNADNEEWINASGRITRSVMFDLINNVFDLSLGGLSQKESEQAKAAFNNEFANVADAISYKSGEMLSQLKVVTEQDKGMINEIGVLSVSEKTDDIFEPMYVLDSPITAFKMLNYLHEFSLNYKKLLSRNPDYLYQTALPTVEWIEQVLSRLSEPSLKQGQAMLTQAQQSGVTVSVFHSI